MEKKKINSYVKMIIVMCIGGAIGAVIGLGSFYFNGNLLSVFSSLTYMIESNANIILCIITSLALLITAFIYYKSGNILSQSLTAMDDDTQDLLDKKYDFWGTFGIASSNVLLGAAFIVFAFSLSDIMFIDLSKIWQSIVSFLLCMIICITYQITIVKQMKKKDPTKYGDAMSFRFQDKFLETCDEGEKMIIYKSAYKTFVLMQQITIYVLGIACLVHFILGTGLTAVVLVGILYIIMTTTYSIYSIKLQKSRE